MVLRRQVGRGKTLFETIERESGRRIAAKKNGKKSGSHHGSGSETGARSTRGRVGAQDIIVGMMIMMGIVTALPGIMVEENVRGRRRLIGRRRRRKRKKGMGTGHQSMHIIGMWIRKIGGRIGIGIRRVGGKRRGRGRIHVLNL